MTADWLRGRVLFIADLESLGDRLKPTVRACLEGGVRMVQLRGKRASDLGLYRLGLDLRDLCSKAGALLFINDRVDLALAVEADGVHLGQGDLPLPVARSLAPSIILGATCRTAEQAAQAQSSGADYVALGAVFPSPTKPEAPVVGLERLREVRAAVSLPICAIGGITVANAAEVFQVGADFVAVISLLAEAEDPVWAAAGLVELCGAA